MIYFAQTKIGWGKAQGSRFNKPWQVITKESCKEMAGGDTVDFVDDQNSQSRTTQPLYVHGLDQSLCLTHLTPLLCSSSSNNCSHSSCRTNPLIFIPCFPKSMMTPTSSSGLLLSWGSTLTSQMHVFSFILTIAKWIEHPNTNCSRPISYST